MYTFDFVPYDTLFCRDQRPIEAGNNYGKGASLPLPTTFHSALRTALLESSNEIPLNSNVRKTPRKGRIPGTIGTKKFDWLNICGPFPVVEQNNNSVILYPMPADIVERGSEQAEEWIEVSYLRLREINFRTNLNREFIKFLPVSFEIPSKEQVLTWLQESNLYKYLKGECFEEQSFKIFGKEYKTSVAISSETHSSVEGQFFAAEHLRLRDNVKLKFSVNSPPAHKKDNTEIKIENISDFILKIGGEQKFGTIYRTEKELSLPEIEISSEYVKWVLLTPAVFINGWLPGWVDTGTGKVKLRLIDKEKRREFRRRRRESGWKYEEEKDDAEQINAYLISVCIRNRPVIIGGWKMLEEDGVSEISNTESNKKSGGRPTMLAVPAGSVFYFKGCGNSPEERLKEAGKLKQALHGRWRSDFYGNKGMGLGVCGTWQHQTTM